MKDGIFKLDAQINAGLKSDQLTNCSWMYRGHRLRGGTGLLWWHLPNFGLYCHNHLFISNLIYCFAYVELPCISLMLLLCVIIVILFMVYSLVLLCFCSHVQHFAVFKVLYK